MSYPPQGPGTRATAGLLYKGTLDAFGGAYPTGAERGDYYIVSKAGTISGTSYKIHDWAVYNGSSWDKLDAADAVTSVDGQTGAVSLSSTYLGIAAKAADSDKLDGYNSTAFATHSTTSQTIWVYEDAVGTGDGSTKANGFTTLQAAIDSLPDIVNHAVTIKVSKGSTNYLEEHTLISKIINESLTIQGEYYAFGSCESNAVAGKIVDADGTFTGLLVGDRVVCSKYSGTVEASSIEDYFYATITEIGSGYIQTSEGSKIPTIGWVYSINQTIMDGNNSSSITSLIESRSNITIKGIYFQNMLDYSVTSHGAIKIVGANVTIWNCIFKDTIGIGAFINSMISIGSCAFISNYNWALTSYYGNHITGWYSIFIGASTSYDNIYLANTSNARFNSCGFFNSNKALNINAGCGCNLLNCHIDSTCLTGVYGYNTTLVSCTNNAVTPLNVLTSGGKIDDSTLWNGQARPTLEANKFLQVKEDGSGFQLTAVATGGSNGGITWTEVTGTSQTAAVDNGYICNNAALVTITLPATCAVGKVIALVGKGAGLWKIAQNANQYIKYGSLTSTTGTGGYIASTGQYDCIELICTTADVGFTVRSSIGSQDVV